jgi:hypothetical protein
MQHYNFYATTKASIIPKQGCTQRCIESQSLALRDIVVFRLKYKYRKGNEALVACSWVLNAYERHVARRSPGSPGSSDIQEDLNGSTGRRPTETTQTREKSSVTTQQFPWGIEKGHVGGRIVRRPTAMHDYHFKPKPISFIMLKVPRVRILSTERCKTACGAV